MQARIDSGSSFFAHCNSRTWAYTLVLAYLNPVISTVLKNCYIRQHQIWRTKPTLNRIQTNIVASSKPNVITVDKITNNIEERTTNSNNNNNINVQRECNIASSISSNEAWMQQDNDEDQAKNVDEICFTLINEDDTLASGSDIIDSFNLSCIKSERIKAEIQNNDWNTSSKTFKSGCPSEEKYWLPKRIA
uniref:Uncharacterized protein n=1 Tax=Romanomermis culicivorax TaxID=13658 RepID=A0A915JGJ0_ROMCU